MYIEYYKIADCLCISMCVLSLHPCFLLCRLSSLCPVDKYQVIPPGNLPGNTDWTGKKKPVSKMMKMTSGKGLEDLSIPLPELIDNVIKDLDIVLFIKGTTTEPACGFSHQIIQDLNSLSYPFTAINVLDEMYNPGVRDAIKVYSQWPTIPQVSALPSFSYESPYDCLCQKW